MIVSAYSHRRYGHQMVHMDGQLYVLGGASEDDKRVLTVDIYDVPSRQWREHPSMELMPSTTIAGAVVLQMTDEQIDRLIH